MRAGVVRLLIINWTVLCLAGCRAPENARTPSSAAAERELSPERRALEERHLQLQKQVLNELERLREQRGPTDSSESPHHGAPKLLIFGGASHEVYLGCLCEGQHPDSVFNLEGEFGSGYSSTSLRNKFAPYGSNHEDTSACNAKAKHPPSVVASDGKSLGLLTVNASLKKRIAAPSVTDWLARMCRL